MRQVHADEVTRLSEELRALRDNYEVKIREYEELMDIKVQLDQEIATYRALLQEEETRYIVVEYKQYLEFLFHQNKPKCHRCVIIAKGCI